LAGISGDGILRAHQVLLVGESGSGKSTLLASMVPEGGTLVHARELGAPGSLADRLDAAAVEPEHTDELRSGRRVLLLDGFDEIPRYRQSDLAAVMEEALRTNALARVVVAARAAPIEPRLTSWLMTRRMPPMDRSGATRMLASLIPTSRVDDEIVSAMLDASDGNPLLLTCAVRHYVAGGQIPRTRAEILGEEARRCVAMLGADAEPAGDREAMRVACERIALDALLSETADTTLERAVDELAASLDTDATEDALARAAADPGGLLVPGPVGMVRFRHRLVMEYMAARALRDDHERLGALAERGHATDAIGFALGMSRDPGACLAAVAHRTGLDGLQRLERHLATLDSEVLDAARADLVGRIRKALRGRRANSPPVLLPPGLNAAEADLELDEPGAAASVWPATLDDRWRQLLRSNATGTPRGQEFEEFMVAFFQQFFTKAELQYRTKTSHIDILLTIPANDFWSRFGSLACAECKNRRSKATLPDINQMIGERDVAHRIEIGFFVAQAGFTKDASDRIRLHAASRDRILIVPIDGIQIGQTLADREEPAAFFERIVRDTMLLKRGKS
jgi:hypothetical protein